MTVDDRTRTLDFHAVAVGDVLPELVLPMTPTRVVAGAIASRDFMPVHHDRDYANQQGAPEIFMNILSDTAYCSRFVTDWAGPEAMVTRLAIRLGVPCFAGSVLTYSGRVASTSLAADDREGIVEVEVRAANDLGDHITGRVTITLPAATG
jgi:acyl dehydratase